MNYDVIVVGGGHAGCEACLASSRMNHPTLLITGNINNIADTPCNPSIGGPAKGNVVREIDALGGEMGRNTDKSILQIKKLNTKKGPAVWALRAQIDKVDYHKNMLKTINNQENLTVKEGMVEDLLIKNNKIYGIKLSTGEEIYGKCVILTTGTYMKGQILRGSSKHSGGPHGEKPSLFLSDNLKKLGFTIKRLKTGTPPRIEKATIDYTNALLQPGDNTPITFSHLNKVYYDVLNQEDCYLIYTTPTTHEIIKENLEKSSMYGGYVEGIGPRYCPSIEDKVVKFADKNRHQVFIEPEGLGTNEMYVGGMSSSLPEDVQYAMYRSVPGLENAKIVRNAYAIEYDCIDGRQLKPSLEFKNIHGLFSAGQFNGSSGYEEAAAQGIVAGINAARMLQGKEPMILDRSEAYIGVLIDDIVTKESHEPYRMMTSRAEYRLLLRQDNADQRLTKKGYEVGLINEERYQRLLKKEELIKNEIERVEHANVGANEKVQTLLKECGSTPLSSGSTIAELIRRPELTYDMLKPIDDARPDFPKNLAEEVAEQVNICIKYAGYITRQMRQVEQFKKLERKKIPDDIDYDNVNSLRIEAIQKLKEHRPASIGQASRISGVSPADISVLLVYLGGVYK